MKRKILSLILVLMLIPFASVFTACKKDEGYNLNNLKVEFNAISNGNKNIKIVEGNFVFDFSNHRYLGDVVETVEPYNELNKFNTLFSNLMSFACDYVELCSANEVVKNVELKNQIKEDLDNLMKSINNVDRCIDMFSESINGSYGANLSEEQDCLTRFEILLETYGTMYEKAIDFNNTLADLYFNNVLINSNPDIYSIKYEDFNSSVVISKLNSRLQYQKFLLSQSYFEKYLGNGIAKRIVEGEIISMYEDDYLSNFTAINKTINETIAVEKANNDNGTENSNKKRFYALAVQAQNIQATLKNDNEKFVSACNAIDYTKTKNNQFATAQELLCVDIIDSHNALIQCYNEVLVGMLSIIV